MPSANTRKARVRKPTKQSPRGRRGIGRPAAGPHTVGREALIEHTCQLLSQLPPNRITRAEVARRMGVDPSLIRYYFRDRSTLLLAAVERLTAEFCRIRDRELAQAGNEPEGKLRARIAALLQFEIAYPFFHRLLIDEFVHMKSPAVVRYLHELTTRSLDAYSAMLDSGFDARVFRRSDSTFLFLAVIGMCEFFVKATSILRIAAGKNVDQRSLSVRYRDFVCDLLLNGLKLRPESNTQLIPAAAGKAESLTNY
jgi:AcrR family transcriptional regulator